MTGFIMPAVTKMAGFFICVSENFDLVNSVLFS